MTQLEAARLEIAQASRILVGEHILDAFGHVSRRHPERPDTFLISRSLAPALVTPDTIVELDLNGDCASEPNARLFLERFLHAEIYRRRRDVYAIVHSHAMSVLPFASVPSVPVTAISHMCGFLHNTPPPFDLADHAGPASDLLIRNSDLGRALAEHLGGAAVVLMRGHGYTAVGPNVPLATYRAIYAARNCEIQLAVMKIGQPVYLSAGEASAADAATMQECDRAWNYWLRAHVPAGELDPAP